ncbi:AI-2E family transporter [Limobrevibacterium gyesilva]|uniref:AI-2E family transporter n=1 Tax=Limobrevibacterium gyesilva TaxID=2991712 RepID=A0AA41YN03_9PROT|nr:AI-2E family transporter [Limobrevibacterium gyesilva]MCW3473483.1 AI-2E family transporter [Limobrevibacterium gyesilva]
MTADRGLKTMVGLLMVVALAAALHQASSVFAPVAFALLIIALVWPLHRWLQSWLPKLLALAVSVAVIVSVFLAFGSLIVWGFGRVGRWLVGNSAQFQAVYDQVMAWLEGHGVAVAAPWAEHFNVGWLMRAAQEITGRVNTATSFWLVVLVYVLIGLAEVDDMARRIRAIESPIDARVLMDGATQTAIKLRKYMLVRTVMSVITGVLVWLFARLTGLQFAAEWGVIAFALNYIPFIGPFFATVLPTLFAIAQFETWQDALGIFLCLNAIQFLVGSYIEPRVAGRVLSISPFVVLFAVLLWAFLWGLFGAFIGVPIVIAVITFCAQHPSSRWLAGLLGGSPRASTETGG